MRANGLRNTAAYNRAYTFCDKLPGSKVPRAARAFFQTLLVQQCLSAQRHKPEDIEPAFAKIAQDGTNGIVRGPGSALFNWRAQVGASALKHRLPIMTYVAEEVPHGLLMSYGQDVPDFFRRTAVYVDKILKGAKPADLPVEQPTKFKLVRSVSLFRSPLSSAPTR